MAVWGRNSLATIPLFMSLKLNVFRTLARGLYDLISRCGTREHLLHGHVKYSKTRHSTLKIWLTIKQWLFKKGLLPVARSWHSDNTCWSACKCYEGNSDLNLGKFGPITVVTTSCVMANNSLSLNHHFMRTQNLYYIQYHTILCNEKYIEFHYDWILWYFMSFRAYLIPKIGDPFQRRRLCPGCSLYNSWAVYR